VHGTGADEIDESDETTIRPGPREDQEENHQFPARNGPYNGVGGSCGSLGLLFIEGSHSPLILLILFVGWVASPFLALLVANVFSKRWSVPTRVTLYFLELIITVCSIDRIQWCINSARGEARCCIPSCSLNPGS